MQRAEDFQHGKTEASRCQNRPATAMVGKRIQFDRDTWNAIEVLAQDQMKDIPEIVEEAMRDLLKKNGRSADFRQQLRMSAGKTERPSRPEKTAPRPAGKRTRKRSLTRIRPRQRFCVSRVRKRLSARCKECGPCGLKKAARL